MELSHFGFSSIFKMVNIHPLFVHFPVALLLAAALFYILGVLVTRDSFLAVGKWNLLSGTAAAALAVWTGLGAEDSISHGGEVHEIMELHEKLGFVILGLSVLLSFWILAIRKNMPSKLKKVFLALLILLSLAIMQSAELGGRMVYLHGTGVKENSNSSLTGMGHVHEGHSH